MKSLIYIDSNKARYDLSIIECQPPMMPVGEIPLIEHTVELLRKHGVTDIAISADHDPWTIVKHLGHGRRWGVHIHYSVREQILGSVGAANKLKWFLDESFVILDGNTYTDLDLSALFSAHRSSGASVTLALHPASDAIHARSVELDAQGHIRRFADQGSALPPSRRACAGAFVVEPSVLTSVSHHPSQNFVPDLLTQWLSADQPIEAFPTTAQWIDVISPESLQTIHQIAQKKEMPKLTSAPGSIIAPTGQNLLHLLSVSLLD